MVADTANKTTALDDNVHSLRYNKFHTATEGMDLYLLILCKSGISKIHTDTATKSVETCTLERLATIDVLVTAVVSLYYYLLIVKAMYITKTDSPLPTFQSDSSSKIALAVCTAGIALFGVVSCIYEWIAAAGL